MYLGGVYLVHVALYIHIG